MTTIKLIFDIDKCNKSSVYKNRWFQMVEDRWKDENVNFDLSLRKIDGEEFRVGIINNFNTLKMSLFL